MAALVSRRVRKTSPYDLPQPDWDNPVCSGLVALFLMTPDGAMGWSDTGQQMSPYYNSGNTTTGIPVNLVDGPAARAVSGSIGYICQNININQITGNSYSLFASGAVTSTAATYSALDDDNGITGQRRFQFRLNAGKLEFIPFNSSTNGSILTPAALTSVEANSGFTMGATVTPSTITAYLNRTKASAAFANALPPNPIVTVGSRKTAVQGWNSGGIQIVAIWSRALTEAEMMSLADNKWQLFRPQPRRLLAAFTPGPTLSLVSANGACTATSSVLAASISLAYASGSSTGIASAQITSVSRYITAATSTGSSIVTANGVALTVAAGSSACAANVSANAYAVWNVVASSASAAGGTGSGVSLVPVAAGSTGTSTANGTSSSLAPSSGSASGTATGTSTANGAAVAFYSAIANALGAASGAATAVSRSSASGAASGAATAASQGVGSFPSSASASGASTASANGVILACASGTATGLATVNGLTVAIYGAAGMSVSGSQVQAIAQLVASALGSAQGKATVSGATEGGLHYTASGDKFAITLVLSPYKLTLNEATLKIKLN